MLCKLKPCVHLPCMKTKNLHYSFSGTTYSESGVLIPVDFYELQENDLVIQVALPSKKKPSKTISFDPCLPDAICIKITEKGDIIYDTSFKKIS